MSAKVLDSFALVAYFRGEPEGLPVKALLEKAAQADKPLLMTEVNYAEVKYIILRKDGAAAWQAAAKVLETLPIAFQPITRALADQAADYKARFTLSLADAFAAALAREKKADLVTGDAEFKPLAKEIKIQWLQ